MAKPQKNKKSEKSGTEKAANTKRAQIPMRKDYTADFEKAWAKYNKAGQVKMADVKVVMNLIGDNDGPLPAQYKDHELSGNYAGYRECHVHGDHLLVYKLTADGKTVIFTDMGTHSELFK